MILISISLYQYIIYLFKLQYFFNFFLAILHFLCYNISNDDTTNLQGGILVLKSEIEDINTLIEKADKNLINIVIDEVLQRNDLSESKRKGFLANLPRFRGEYNV